MQSEEIMRRIVIIFLIVIAWGILSGFEIAPSFSPELLKEAQAKNPEAMYKLALCYHQGMGTTVNYKEAFYWFKKSCQEKDSRGAVHTLKLL